MVFSEAWRSITANASTTIAATMTVLIGMFLLGLFIALGTWVLAFSDNAKEKLLIKVYMCTPITCAQGEASDRQINRTRIALLQTPGVESVRFVSKQDALRQMEKLRPELVEGISTNPLPNGFEVTPRVPEEVKQVSSAIRTSALPGVEKIRDGEKVADRILDFAKVISSFFVVAVVVLLVAATVLIANTIRLSIFARRREIEVMKLVGATNWFVRAPFMIEGLLCGLIGSIAAVLLLLLGRQLVQGVVESADRSSVDAIAFAWNALIVLGVGLLLGLLGSGLTLRRFLRV
jgi:cell division transport system permease protein